MPNTQSLTVLVDTSFLITLYNKKRPNHASAFRYFKYFIEKSIKMYLSTIVISEFQQMQPILDLINSRNYIVLPYNYEHAIKTAELTYNLGGTSRRGSPNPKYKDDCKLMGQAEHEDINYIITEDASTLARYCNKLSRASLFKPKAIIVKNGFDVSIFNNGQTSLIDQG